jgi:L-lactate dehydrogenase complex protein LldF
VEINIPEVLVHLRGQAVRDKQRSIRGRLGPENVSMEAMARIFADRRRYEWAQRLAQRGQAPFQRGGTISWLPPPLSGWTAMRDVKPVPNQTFRQWWQAERGGKR